MRHAWPGDPPQTASAHTPSGSTTLAALSTAEPDRLTASSLGSARQVFSDKMLMQLSIWKKDWDAENKVYEPIDLSYKP